MEELLTYHSLAAFATLSLLEIVLGIDNVVFLAILTGKLPERQQPGARTIGLLLAAAGRIVLLLAISWIITLDSQVVFTLPFDLPNAEAADHHADEADDGGQDDPAAARAEATGETPITVKSLILILGGLFLLGKSTWEIGHLLEGAGDHDHSRRQRSSYLAVLLQILAVDMVFSIDSVLTAVGMVNPDEYRNYWVAICIMVAAVVLAIAVMIAFSGPIARFVNQHPSVKMLALAFLILIGVLLIAEGLQSHIPRGYVYFSMGFALLVEMLNLRARARREKQAAEATV